MSEDVIAEQERTGSPVSESHADTLTAQPHLQGRYGTRRARSSSRRLAWIFGAGVVVVLLLWMVWVSMDRAGSIEIDTRDIGFSIVSDSEVTVRYSVTAPEGTPVSCAVQALNEGFTVVGWKRVDLAGSDERTRYREDSLRTTERAVTGLIYRCWLT